MIERKAHNLSLGSTGTAAAGCFEASFVLTSAEETSALHRSLLKLLETIPEFRAAWIYESRNHEAAALQEDSGRPLLLDNVLDEGAAPLDATLDPMMLRSLRSHLPAVKPLESDGIERRVYPIPGEMGPLRLLVLEAAPLSPDQERYIGYLLAIYHNQVRLLDKKERDPLTGLLNRLSFDERLVRFLERVVNRAEASGRGAGRPWLAFLDIDHFKRINDRFGHLYGDEILILFGRLLQRHFRHTDLPFRYGGEEFVVILSAASEAEARRALERFRAEVEGFAFPTIGQVTVSVGFAAFRGVELPSTLVDEADQALYYAKAHGRNRVVCFSDLEPGGPSESGEGKVELF